MTIWAPVIFFIGFLDAAKGARPRSVKVTLR
jgi:hypothetical protein